MAKKTKNALVLSGGGFKGAFQIGALDYLREAGLINPNLHFDVIAGISAGALNGSFIATQQYDALKTIWRRIEEEGSHIIYTSEFLNAAGEPQISYDTLKARFFPEYQLKINLWRGLSLLLFPRRRNRFFQREIQQIGQEVAERLRDFRAIATNQPLADLLRRYLDVANIPPNVVFTSGFVSLIDGKYYNPQPADYASNDDFIRGVLASTTVPVVWPPVGDISLKTPLPPVHQVIDGGLKNSTPLGDVIKLMSDEQESAEYRILIINNNSGQLDKARQDLNIAAIALRSLTEITLAEILDNDIREFVRINALVRQAQEQGVALYDERGKPLRQFSYKIIQPQGGELGDVLDASPEVLRRRYALGRQRAQEAFAQANDPNWPTNMVA